MDRNRCDVAVADQLDESLSARRAWIEISGSSPDGSSGRVALRKESVDRNNLSGFRDGD